MIGLNQGERDVMALIARGRTRAEIVHRLGITRATFYDRRWTAIKKVAPGGTIYDVLTVLGWLRVPDDAIR